MNKKLSIKQIAVIGLMAALVFVGSKIEIRIPSILGVTRFHLGNGLCILSGFILGAVSGGMAAGLGSLFFDVVFWGGNPAGWLVTFATKFIMAFVAGACFKHMHFNKLSIGDGRRLTLRLVISSVLGQIAYIAGYLLKEYITYKFIMSSPDEAILLMLSEKLLASSINAVIAVILATVLYRVTDPVLRKNGFNF